MKWTDVEGILPLVLSGLMCIFVWKDLPPSLSITNTSDIDTFHRTERALCTNAFFTSAGNAWKMHLLDSMPPSGSDGVKLADVNGDKLPDLVSGFEESGVSRVYLHPGYEKVQEDWSFIELSSPDVEDAVLVDLDDNGIVDLVTAAEGNTNQIKFHWAPNQENNYMDYQKWNTEVVPATDGISAWMFVVPVDMDGVNGIDLVIGSKRKRGVLGDDMAEVGWLQSPTEPRKIGEWKYFPLSSAGWIMSILPVDINDDGLTDILISDRKFSSHTGVRWLENPGNDAVAFYGLWKSHMIGASKGEPMFLAMADLDGDTSEEILVPDLNKGLVILEQQRETTQHWKESIIPYPLWSGGRGKSVSVGDINSDGKLQVVLSFEEEGKVASIPYEEYQSEGKYSVILGNFNDIPFISENWSFQKISGMKGRKFDLVTLIDLDGDGDLDVLTNDENEENDGLGVVWYENMRI